MTNGRRRALEATLALYLPLVPSTALGQGAPDTASAAQAAFDQARVFAQAGDYTDACPKFEESERLAHGTGTLLNLADCYDKVGRTASAWLTFLRARDSAREAGQTDREQLATLRASVLEPRVTRLVVHVADPPPEGLHVFRDGTELSPSDENRALPVDPARYAMRAERAGRSWSDVVSATEPGATIDVTIPALDAATPVAAPAPAAPAATTPMPVPAPTPTPVVAASPQATPSAPGDHAEPTANSQKTWGWIASGVGVAGFAVSGVFSALAVSKNKDSESHCRTTRYCTPEGLSERNAARSDGNVATAAFVVGAVGLGTGLVLLLTASDDEPAKPAAPAVNASVSSRGANVDVAVRF
jgi:hypothetical protein